MRSSISTTSRLLRRLQGDQRPLLAIEKGEMRAVIGPNGAGKTTMMDIITGKTRPDAGGDLRRHRTTSPGSTRRPSPRSASAASSRSRRCSRPTRRGQPPAGARNPRGVFATLFHRLATARASASTSCSIGRLRRSAHRRAGELSHGQKQWLEIGMLLAQEPKLLLVDEPAAGMTDAETMRPPSCCGRSPGPAFRRRGRARHGFRARARRAR
jgi:urea transport system ATP-binding protein